MRSCCRLLSVLYALGLLLSAQSVTFAQLGVVKAFGFNQSGQVGDGTVVSRRSPVSVLNLTGVVQVAGGDSHSLALKSDGTVWAWGGNAYGQLGDGTTVDKTLPVSVLNLTSVVQVAAAGDHSLALKSDGTVWAWGNNGYFQIGDGTSTTRLTPVQTPGLSGISQVAAGRYHSFALATNSTVWAWGRNDKGQLGDGTTADRATPVHLTISPLFYFSGVQQIAAGELHSIAVKKDGTVWTWGYNHDGELGNGSNIDSSTPSQVPGVEEVIQVAAGSYHNLALGYNNVIWAWGANWEGQLGCNNSNLVSSPNAVHVVNLNGNLNNVVQVAAGWGHSLALRQDGIVWTWGYNTYGALGTGNSYSWGIPTQSLLTNQTYIAAGSEHSLSVRAVKRNTKIVLPNRVLQYATPMLSFLGKLYLGNITGFVPITGKTLHFSIDYTSVADIVTDAAGVAGGSMFESLALGYHLLQADFYGDNLYNDSTQTATIHIIKANTQVSVPTLSASVGQTKALYGTLKRVSDGSLLAGQTLTFTLGSTTLGSATTNANGKAFYYFYVPPGTVGTQTLKVDFAGDFYHNASYNAKPFTITAGGTSTGGKSLTIEIDSAVSLSAILKRLTDKAPLGGKTIRLKVDGMEVGTSTTDDNGVATLPYTPSAMMMPGSHSLAYSFDGDDSYATSATKGLTLTLNKVATRLRASSLKGALGAMLNLSSTLTRVRDGVALGGKTIRLKVDGMEVGTSKTDDNGVATLTYMIPANMMAGAHSLSYSFEEDNMDLASTKAGLTLTVK